MEELWSVWSGFPSHNLRLMKRADVAISATVARNVADLVLEGLWCPNFKVRTLPEARLKSFGMRLPETGSSRRRRSRSCRWARLRTAGSRA
jgi:hypothetical protein